MAMHRDGGFSGPSTAVENNGAASSPSISQTTNPRLLSLPHTETLLYSTSPAAIMRFSPAFFASLAAQAVFGLPQIPPKTGIKSLDVGLAIVGSTTKSVKAEGDAVVTFVEAGVIPLAKTSLNIITQQLFVINETMTPYATGIITPLADAQLNNVVSLLYLSQALVGDVKDLSAALLSDASKQATKAVASELKAVLNAVNPFVEPITTLCKGLAGTSTSAVGKQVFKLTGSLEHTAGAVLDPFRVAVDELI